MSSIPSGCRCRNALIGQGKPHAAAACGRESIRCANASSRNRDRTATGQGVKCGPMPTHKTCTALDWEDVRFFAALAHHRHYASAARALGASPAEVEQRLGNLESALGHRLFRRTGHSLALSAAGAAALADAAQMEMAACSLSQLRAREELSAGDRADCTGRPDPRRR
jgi:hypothetical protein